VQLDLLLLAALSDGPAHGYAVIERVRLRTDAEIELLEGSVYPALHRLEADGLVASRWVVATPRRKREYQITRRGRAMLSQHIREWRRVARAVDSVIGATA
jgi:PadR family transcriptional regulator, regulatory protein PadR